MTVINTSNMANGSVKSTSNGTNGTNGANGANGTLPDLPDKKSPTLTIVHPTEEEKLAIWKKNGAEWCGALPIEAYLRREECLANQEQTKNGGISHWVLIDTAAKSRVVLSSCDTYRKKALITRNGKIEEVVSHGIGSVFCPPECRRRGYAGVMMKLLGEKLRTYQAEEQGKQECAFSILYSDIGKSFYAAHGWEPFNSAHISLSVAAKSTNTRALDNLPSVRPLYADDLPELCSIDERLIRKSMLKSIAPTRASVAVIPDIATISWHHAREQFVGNELHGKIPQIKGAIVGTVPGKRVWCYWTRMFYNPDPCSVKDNTLHILRLVIEEHGPFNFAKRCQDTDVTEYIPAITALFKLAREEAAEWNMEDVQIWNPTDVTVAGVMAINKEALVIDRDLESIASLKWYGEKIGEGPVNEWIDWLGNEKYGWC